MASQYPNLIDGLSQLPKIKDGITPLNSSVINALRSAIINIETELGTNPSGESSSVKDRLSQIESLINQSGGGSGDYDEAILSINSDIETINQSLQTLSQDLSNLENSVSNILNDASNLGSGPAASGQILTADGAGNSSWQTLDLDSGVETLGDLTDVNLSTPPSDGQTLIYDADTQTWLPETLMSGGASLLSELSDVDLTTTTPTDGQSLVYDSDTSKWVPATISSGDSGGPIDLNDLNNVDTSNLEDGYILVYDSDSQTWVSEELGLDKISDIDLSTPPTDGQALIYDAGNSVWIPGTVSGGGEGESGASTLGELTDVFIATSPDDGQVLVYDSNLSKWIAGDVTNADGYGSYIISEGVFPYGGARLGLSDVTIHSSIGAWAPIFWDKVEINTGNFVDPDAPNGFTIPAGISKIRLHASIGINITNPIGNNKFCFAKNNVAAFPGSGGMMLERGSYVDPAQTMSSDVISVEEGDYFEVWYWSSESFSVENGGFSWFSLEVIERDSANVGVNLALDGISDVDIVSPVSGQAVVYNGTFWENGYPILAANVAQNWSAGFRGAMACFTAAKDIDPPVAGILWDDTEYDTDGFWSAAQPSRFTIPAGVTMVRLWACISPNGAVLNGNHYLYFLKNGTVDFVGSSENGGQVGYQQIGMVTSTPPFAVSEGDYFEVGYELSATGAKSFGTKSYFAIEVVETIYSNPRPYTLKVWSPGAPSSNQVLFLDVAERVYRLDEDGGNSRAYASTAPTSEATLDVRHNNISIGSIVFSAGTNAGVFSITEVTEFEAGDRLSIVAPNTPDDTLADIALSIEVSLT